MLDDILALFLTNNQFPIGGVEGIKGFRLIDCINVWVEEDQVGVWGNTVNPQIWIVLLNAADNICSYQSVSRCAQAIDYGKPFSFFVKGL